MDVDVVIRAQRGDKDAYAILAVGIADRFLGVARRILRDFDIAEDATQQALLTMWRDLPRLPLPVLLRKRERAALVVRARRLVPARGLSQLVNDLLAERVAELEQAELEAQMREGYIATRQERQGLNADWQIIDGEGWPA